jgi:prepilin-type N-terminal cleavage/methylation domain-containing protein
MSACLATKKGKSDEGFSLIELVLVLVTMGILVAIAIPTYIGYTTHAQNRSAQSSLRDALVGASNLYLRYESFYGPPPRKMDWIAQELYLQDPTLSFTQAKSSEPSQVSLYVVNSALLSMASYAKDNECWFALLNFVKNKKGLVSYGALSGGSSLCRAEDYVSVSTWSANP